MRCVILAWVMHWLLTPRHLLQERKCGRLAQCENSALRTLVDFHCWLAEIWNHLRGTPLGSLWGRFQGGLTMEGRSTLNMGGTTLWAGVSDWIKMKTCKASRASVLSTFCFPTVDAVWWTAPHSCLQAFLLCLPVHPFLKHEPQSSVLPLNCFCRIFSPTRWQQGKVSTTD